MKKLLTSFASLTFALLASLSLVACGQMNDTVTASAGTKLNDVEFKNDSSFSVVYKEDNHYVAEGKANKMTQEQATVWGTEKDSKFAIVNVKVSKDSTLVYGWKDSKTMDTAFKTTEIDGNLVKKIAPATDDNYDFILAVSEGETARHPEKQIFRVEVTEKDAKEAVAYTIDFSALYDNKEAA